MRYDLQRTIDERATQEKSWRDILEQYRAPEPKALRRFPFEGAPLARDTEILTRGGWRRIDAIRIGEDVLTRRDDGMMEWGAVQALPQRYADKLYHFKSRSIDLLVTEEHIMLCEAQRSGRLSRIPAAALWGTTGYFLPQHGEWTGKSPDHLFGHNAGNICELIGWYLAEGCIVNGSTVTICQSKTGNPEKCRRIETLLTRLGWKFTQNDRAFYVSRRSMPIGLRDMLMGAGKAKTKRVPAILFDLSPILIDRLLTGMMLGDGNIYDDYPQGTSPKANYYTISRGLADDVQVLTILCGLHARVRSRVRVESGGTMGDGRQIQGANRCYEVTVCSTPRAKYDRSFREIVEYNDVAFCVTVKNHAIYARRNGTACWTGNSNYTFPITAMNVDPIHARLMRTIHAPTNIWTVTPLNSDWRDIAKPVQDFLEYVDSRFLKMQDVNYRTLLEVVKLGTGVYKTGWRFEKYRTMGYDQSMNRVRLIRNINQPLVDQVHLANFFVPPEAMSVDADAQGGAQWVAERMRYRPEQLQALGTAQEPYFPNFDPDALKRVQLYEETSPTQYEQRVQQLDQMSGAFSRRWHRPIELYELWVRFDTTGNGHEDDIVVLWHQPTRTILRALYQPYAHGKRPYHVARYIRGDGFYGVGVGEQLRMWQTAISDVLNFNVNKILLTHAPIIKAKEGANILPNEAWFPGKTVFVNDPKNDIEPFFLTDPAGGNGEINQLISFLQEGGKARTGLTDLQFGSVGAVPSRTPATTVQALLQEGNTRFDLMIQDLRLNALGPIGLQTLENIVQQVGNQKNNPEGAQYVELAAMVLGAKPGEFVDKILELPHTQVEAGLGVELTATSGTNNKELQRQSDLALLQVFGQWGPQLLQLAQVAVQQQGTPVAQIATELFDGARQFLLRTLEQFDFRSPEDVVPNLSAALAAAQAQSQGQPLSPIATGAAPIAGAPLGYGGNTGLPPTP